LLYYWKGRRSRFIGFHAVQSLVMNVALLPAMGAMFYLMLVVVAALDRKGPSAQPYASMVAITIFCASLALPFITNIPMGFLVMRGRPCVLPVLGRLAKLIIGDRAVG
jgi:uncharacterized membrane protein